MRVLPVLIIGAAALPARQISAPPSTKELSQQAARLPVDLQALACTYVEISTTLGPSAELESNGEES